MKYSLSLISRRYWLPTNEKTPPISSKNSSILASTACSSWRSLYSSPSSRKSKVYSSLTASFAWLRISAGRVCSKLVWLSRVFSYDWFSIWLNQDALRPAKFPRHADIEFTLQIVLALLHYYQIVCPPNFCNQWLQFYILCVGCVKAAHVPDVAY